MTLSALSIRRTCGLKCRSFVVASAFQELGKRMPFRDAILHVGDRSRCQLCVSMVPVLNASSHFVNAWHNDDTHLGGNFLCRHVSR